MEQIKGSFVKNPQGVLQIAKRKDGSRFYEVMRRVGKHLTVRKQTRPNPLAVLRVSNKSRTRKQEEGLGAKPLTDDGAGAEIDRNRMAKPTNFDPGSCLAPAAEKEE